MQKVFLLSLSISTAVYAWVASQMWGSPGFISLPFEFMRLMYVPCILLAFVCAGVSIAKAIQGASRLFFVSCFLLSLPMIGYFSYRPEYFYMKGYQGDQKLLAEYRDAPNSLLLALVAYYQLHPDRFHWIGNYDFVTVNGFGDFLKAQNPSITWSGLDPSMFQDNTDPIVVDGDQVKTPWGAPIRFLANTNGDFYVSTPDGKAGSDLVNDPWRKSDSVCKIIVGAWADTPSFSKRYFPTTEPHNVVTLNDMDYAEATRTSGKYLHDRLIASP